MKALTFANFIVGFLFAVCYAYQAFYMILAIVKKPKELNANPKKHKYAVLISARNEETEMCIRDSLQCVWDLGVMLQALLDAELSTPPGNVLLQ